MATEEHRPGSLNDARDGAGMTDPESERMWRDLRLLEDRVRALEVAKSDPPEGVELTKSQAGYKIRAQGYLGIIIAILVTICVIALQWSDIFGPLGRK
jgi:hypothetical protein